MANLSADDVRNGKAIPQPGDTVGDHVYLGGDPASPSRYQPVAVAGERSSQSKPYTLYLVAESGPNARAGFSPTGHVFIGGQRPDGTLEAGGFTPKHTGNVVQDIAGHVPGQPGELWTIRVSSGRR